MIPGVICPFYTKVKKSPHSQGVNICISVVDIFLLWSRIIYRIKLLVNASLIICVNTPKNNVELKIMTFIGKTNK